MSMLGRFVNVTDVEPTPEMIAHADALLERIDELQLKMKRDQAEADNWLETSTRANLAAEACVRRINKAADEQDVAIASLRVILTSTNKEGA